MHAITAMKFPFLTSLVLFLSTVAALAELRLPAVISDHMVLQANAPAAIWGWADAGAAVTVEFSGQKKTTTAAMDGSWCINLDPLPPSRESRELIVTASNLQSKVTHRKCADVLVGEVWLASGQSNMAMQIKGPLHGSVDNADAEIAAATHPEIRMFMHDKPYAIYELPVPPDAPAQDAPGHWQVCSPATVANFSAMGYFVARDLLRHMDTPVGVLSASVGGTPIEAWTSLDAQQKNPAYTALLADWDKRLIGFEPAREQAAYFTAKDAWIKQRSAALKAKQPAPKAPLPFKNIGVMKPGRLFNGSIAPLVPYTLRGVLWYQGERNAAGPFTGLYGEQMKTLISDWRSRWGTDLYFAWVQLPAFLNPQKLPSEPKGWGVAVRDGQRQALSVPHTGMAITMDLGGEKAGHPTNKSAYAARLSTVVLHDVYKAAIPVWSGPLYKDSSSVDGRMVLTFTHGAGLKSRSGKLEGFAIAGEDQKFIWAKAKVEHGKVIVWHEKVPAPKAVRYSWASNPLGNLINKAALPASPFRTDNWP